LQLAKQAPLPVNKAKLYLLAYKKNFVFFIDKPEASFASKGRLIFPFANKNFVFITKQGTKLKY
jgi:hypothetical protein